MFGLFGPLFFGLGKGGVTPYDIEKTMPTRYGTHELHLQKPVLEYGGPQLVEVGFKMFFCAPWTADPMLSLITLQEFVDLHTPQILLIGLNPIGRGTSEFVVTELGEQWKYFWKGGKLMGLEVDVKLKEFATPNPFGDLVNNLLSKVPVSPDVLSGGMATLSGLI